MEKMICGVTLMVTTDLYLTDEQARDAAADWAADAGFDLGLTSTSRDEPWIRVSATATIPPSGAASVPERLVTSAVAALVTALGSRGAKVTRWHAVELLDAAEIERRATRPALPPLVDAAGFAALCEVDRSRIYHMVRDRPAGFPTPVLDGYWLRAEAEFYARTRKRTPGPVAAPSS